MWVRYKNFAVSVIALSCVAIAVFWLILDPDSYKYVLSDLDRQTAHTRVSLLRSHRTRYVEEKDYLLDELLEYIFHPSFQCEDPVVLGGMRMANHDGIDGDKIVCMKPGPGLKKGCLVYSFGISEDWSFEEAIQKRFQCEVHAFDPSLDKEDHLHSKDIWFYDLGLGNFDGEVYLTNLTWRIKTLDHLLNRFGHKNRTIDVLKMDIEGCEYFALSDILEKRILHKVNHLCVEIHLNKIEDWKNLLQLLQRIEEETGLGLYSTRNNSIAPFQPVPGLEHRREQLYYELAWVRYKQASQN